MSSEIRLSTASSGAAVRRADGSIRRAGISGIVAPLVLATLLGCGSSEPPETTVLMSRETPDVPPAEMRMILEGLSSNRPHMQYAALEMLSRFPTVAQAYREHLQRLQEETRDQRVRQKAAEVLASLDR